MSEQTLKPFKAYFEYSQKGNFKDFFDELLWSRLFDEDNIRTVKSIIHNSSSMFKIPYLLSNSKINLDFEKIHSVTPENVSLNDRSQYFSFKFDSKPIKVIQNFYSIINLIVTKLFF